MGTQQGNVARYRWSLFSFFFPARNKETPTPTEEPEDSSEIDNQLHLLESGDQSDVTLICEGRPFPVHTHILSARSDVFMAIFCDLRENRTVHIANMQQSALKNMLHYMYSGEVPTISLHATLKLYTAAEEYFVESLKGKCLRLIKRKLSEDNACEVLSFSSGKRDTSLKDAAITYLSGRKLFLLSETWRRFCNTNPELGIEVFLAFVRSTP